MMLAVDAGYGYTKVANPAGRRAVWPTTLRRREAGAVRLNDALGAAVDGHAVRIRRAGEATHYQVGESGRRAWAADAAERTGYDVQVLTAARLLAGGGDVDLLLGLPLGLWSQVAQRRALRTSLEGRSAMVAVDREPESAVTIRSVRVLPQAAGAFQYALDREPALALRPVGLIDVGYRTTDFLVMRRADAGLAPDEAACGSVDLGAGQVYERVRQSLTEQAGVLIPEGAVEDALAHYGGRLYLQGREVDAAARVEEGMRHLAARGRRRGAPRLGRPAATSGCGAGLRRRRTGPRPAPGRGASAGAAPARCALCQRAGVPRDGRCGPRPAGGGGVSAVAAKTGAPFTVRLGPDAVTALEFLCARWRVGKAEAIRRAIGEVAGGYEVHRPVLDALTDVAARLERMEARLAAGVPTGAPTSTGGANPETDAAGRAAAATRQTLAAWALGEEE